MALQYSRFPARVRFADGTEVNRAAVVVIDRFAELAVLQKDGPFEGGTVNIVATLSGVDAQVIRRQATLTADTGEVWEVGEGDGCGCRSSLLSWYQGRLRGQPLGT